MPSSSATNTPRPPPPGAVVPPNDINKTMLDISNFLDEKIFLPMYSKSAGDIEYSVSGFSKMTKVSGKLIPIKVWSAGIGIFCVITSLRLFLANEMRFFVYLLCAYDLFRISYNSYGRVYFASVTRKAIANSTQQIGESIMSFFTGKKSGSQPTAVADIMENVDWTCVTEGTIISAVYSKVHETTLLYVVHD